KKAAPAPAAKAAAPAPVPPPAAPAAAKHEVEDHARSSPLVRKIAREHNVDLGQVKGSGLGGRITKEDILAFIEGQESSGAEAARVAASPATSQPGEGARLTFMPFFVRAAIIALQQFPIVNASMEGDSIHYHKHVNVGIAVALDWGLIVPVLKNADELNF